MNPLAHPEMFLALLVLLLLFGMLAGYFLVRLSRLHRELHQARQESRSLSDLINAHAATTKGLHGRLLGLERQLATPPQPVSQPTPVAQEPPPPVREEDYSNSPYAEAIARVRQGASAQELRTELGLSRDEADLLCRLHRIHPAS